VTAGFLLGLIGLGALAGLTGGVGAGNSFGLAGFIPGFTTAAKQHYASQLLYQVLFFQQR
jgi:hypothetical protein